MTDASTTDAETDAQPMTDADIAPAADEATTEAPLKGATDDEDAAPGTRQAIKDGAGKIGQQATDKLRMFADDGKAKAVGALDQVVQMLNDAAGTVDEKVGEQYGQYARTAAGTVSSFAETVKAKDVNELIDDARHYVRQSPGIAIAAAAAIGFAISRIAQSGLDGEKR